METAVTGGSALSLAELSRRTGLSRSSVLRRLRSGDIEGASRRDDGRWEIPESAVAVLVDEDASEAVVDVVGDDAVMDLRTAASDTDTDTDAEADLDVIAEADADLDVIVPAEAPRGMPIRASGMDIRPPSLDPELERGLRAELADARRQAAVAEAVATERLDTIETLRDALETIRQILPAVGMEPVTLPDDRVAADAVDDDECERFDPIVDAGGPAVVVEARDVADDHEWVWQTSPLPEPKADRLRRIFRRR